MSLGARMTFEEAYKLGQEVAERLRPTVEYLKAVGSLRRRRTSIGDIEFLARPHSSAYLFGGPATIHLPEVRAVMEELGTWVRGGSRMMQITNLLGREETRLELYLVHPPGCACADCPHGPSAWGSMLAIRTGPEDLGRYCVHRMRERGYRHEHGYAKRIESQWADPDIPAPTDTEEAFFELAGVQCLAPASRDDQAKSLWEAYQKARPRT